MTAPLRLRVTLLDTWDETALELPATALVSEVKRSALAASRIQRPAADYLVKYRGAELPEGASTLADAGVAPNGSLIVMLRRRLPVR